MRFSTRKKPQITFSEKWFYFLDTVRIASVTLYATITLFSLHYTVMNHPIFIRWGLTAMVKQAGRDIVHGIGCVFNGLINAIT